MDNSSNNAIIHTQILKFILLSLANWFTISYVLSSFLLNHIQIAENTNNTTPYRHTKFPDFQSIIPMRSPNAHGATKIPDGAAFSGFIQIHTTPPHT